MMMGDEAALTLGIPLKLYWYLYIALVAVITAVLVASCGIIGFVGLITPHIARSLVGTNYRKLFPVATLLGSLFVVWADVFGENPRQKCRATYRYLYSLSWRTFLYLYCD